MTTMLKSATILNRDRSPKGRGVRRFVSDQDGRNTQLDLDPQVFDDMGRPEIITVTIEPGDKLNEEEQDG